MLFCRHEWKYIEENIVGNSIRLGTGEDYQCTYFVHPESVYRRAAQGSNLSFVVCPCIEKEERTKEDFGNIDKYVWANQYARSD